MGLGGVAIAVSPYVIHPKTAVLGRAGGGDEELASFNQLETDASDSLNANERV